MLTSSLMSKAFVVVLLPLMACATYYTLKRIESTDSLLYVAASLALPVMMVGGIAAAMSARSESGSRQLRWLAMLTMIPSALLLLFIWL